MLTEYIQSALNKAKQVTFKQPAGIYNVQLVNENGIMNRKMAVK